MFSRLRGIMNGNGKNQTSRQKLKYPLFTNKEGHGAPLRPPVRAGVRVSGFTGTARMHFIVWVSPNLKLFKLSKQILSSIVDKQA